MQPTDAAKNLHQRYDDALSERKRSGLLRNLPSSRQSGIDFTHNDYLGLSRHPVVVKAAQDAAEKFGTGGRASRLLGAEAALARQLESEIASSKSGESDAAALIFPSGYQLNSGVLSTLLNNAHLGEEPVVFADRLIHASLHQGLALARVRQHRFIHNDLNHLELLLKKHCDGRPAFVIVESVYGMDGDVAPLPELYELKSKFDFHLYVDEAHATGVAGENGYGLAKCGSDQADVVIGTFSKAIGASGGYVVSAPGVIDLLVNHCGAFIYSTAPSPPVIAAALAAWGMLPELQNERDRLRELAGDLRSRLNAGGINTGNSTTNIVPVLTGDLVRAVVLHSRLAEKKLHTGLIRPPTVPPDGTRLRIGLCTTHSSSDIEKLADELCRK